MMGVDPGFKVSHLADAADVLGLGHAIGAGGLNWAGPHDGIAFGRAFTLQQRALDPGETGTNDQLRHREAVMELAKPGDLLVIGVKGQTRGATWGEAHANRARNRGLAGVIIDGATRDVDPLKELAFPTLYKTSTPFKSTNRLLTEAVEQSVDICGVTVRQGDFVAIGPDGFVVIPFERAEEVKAGARKIAAAEQKRTY